MKRLNQTLALASVLWGITAGSASAQVAINTVTVGNPGNANDTTGYGAVGYSYDIGTFEVTANQYCDFLNAVATSSDTYSLYNPNLASNPNVAGIAQGGSAGNYSYSVIGSGNRPVTYVSWFDAARFANWLDNGQPTGGENASTTETGAYNLNGAMSGVISSSLTGSGYRLPTESEWYKAAYYKGPGGGYWTYPTSSSSLPNSRNGSTTDPNSGNFFYNDGLGRGYNGGYAVSDSTTPPTGNALTDVGAFALATSHYGTYDQGGNASEWNDAVIGSAHGLRGGSWHDSPFNVSASGRSSSNPTSETPYVGFRLVDIPEPGVSGCMALGIAILAWTWERKRSR
jgi:formylglycine-generating enzyme